jgi:periplasmic divalent cation tolerance protein
MSDDAPRIVLTTLPTREAARSVARTLVGERLAACVNMIAIDSTYLWDGNVLEEPEILLLIKTRQAKLALLESRLRSIHPYEVPELVVVDPDRVAEPYLAWLVESTK